MAIITRINACLYITGNCQRNSAKENHLCHKSVITSISILDCEGKKKPTRTFIGNAFSSLVFSRILHTSLYMIANVFIKFWNNFSGIYTVLMKTETSKRSSIVIKKWERCYFNCTVLMRTESSKRSNLLHFFTDSYQVMGKQLL